MIDKIILLKHSSEKVRRNQFLIFRNDLEAYILKYFQNLNNIVVLLCEMKDQTTKILKQMHLKSKLVKKLSLLTGWNKGKKEEINESVNYLHTIRQLQVSQNVAKAYRVI